MSVIDVTTLGMLISSRQQGAAMSFITWIVLGLVAGFIGSKIVNKTGEGLVRDILLGVVGAMIGGYLFNLFGATGVTQPDLDGESSDADSQLKQQKSPRPPLAILPAFAPRLHQRGSLQRIFHPGVAQLDLMLTLQLLVKVVHVEIKILLLIKP